MECLRQLGHALGVWGDDLSLLLFDGAVEWLVKAYSQNSGVKFLSLCAVVYMSHQLPGDLFGDSSILLPLLEW